MVILAYCMAGLLGCVALPGTWISASEVMTLWRFTDMLILILLLVIIIINLGLCPIGSSLKRLLNIMQSGEQMSIQEIGEGKVSTHLCMDNGL